MSRGQVGRLSQVDLLLLAPGARSGANFASGYAPARTKCKRWAAPPAPSTKPNTLPNEIIKYLWTSISRPWRITHRELRGTTISKYPCREQ